MSGVVNSHEDEDIFMSGDWATKSKEVASAKCNSGACKGKGPATSKIDDDDDDNFMPTTKSQQSCFN
jgi:hypothetical protein